MQKINAKCVDLIKNYMLIIFYPIDKVHSCGPIFQTGFAYARSVMIWYMEANLNGRVFDNT